MVKITDAITNVDGNLDIKVRYEKVIIVEENVTIPSRALLLKQMTDEKAKADIQAMSDADYLEMVLADLKKRCEGLRSVEIESRAPHSELIGREL